MATGMAVGEKLQLRCEGSVPSVCSSVLQQCPGQAWGLWDGAQSQPVWGKTGMGGSFVGAWRAVTVTPKGTAVMSSALLRCSRDISPQTSWAALLHYSFLWL